MKPSTSVGGLAKIGNLLWDAARSMEILGLKILLRRNLEVAT